jgi:hypothetical protein
LPSRTKERRTEGKRLRENSNKKAFVKSRLFATLLILRIKETQTYLEKINQHVTYYSLVNRFYFDTGDIMHSHWFKNDYSHYGRFSSFSRKNLVAPDTNLRKRKPLSP